MSETNEEKIVGDPKIIEDAKNSHWRQIMISVGEATYTSNWRVEMAKKFGVTDSYINNILHQYKPVTEKIRSKIVALAREAIDRKKNEISALDRALGEVKNANYSDADKAYTRRVPATVMINGHIYEHMLAIARYERMPLEDELNIILEEYMRPNGWGMETVVRSQRGAAAKKPIKLPSGEVHVMVHEDPIKDVKL